MRERAYFQPRAHSRLRTVALAIAAVSVIPLALVVPSTVKVAASASLGAAGSFGAANTSTSTSLTASTATASGGGDLLVASIKDRDTTALASVTGITDSAGSNTWVKAARVTQGSQADEEIWYAANAASVTTVTVTMSGVSAFAFSVVDLAGASSTPLDVTATAGGVSAAASSGTTAAISQASEIVVADVGWNSTVTTSGQTAGYTTSAIQQSTASGMATGEQAAWELASASGTQGYGATLSASTTWTGAIAAFKITTGPPPTITSFLPTHGPVGTPVTITGSGFTGTTAVAFNSTAATFSVTDDMHIATSVPAGASTGPIKVTAPGGSVTSSTNFTVDAPAPTISNFSPTHGVVGATVVINGTGFTGTTAVVFNVTNQPAFTVNSDIKITTTVPAGAGTGPITVTAPGGPVTSSTNFTVDTSPTPTITGFNPTSGTVGTPVTITGTGFTGASAVTFFNNITATFTVTDDSDISTSVPTGATTGVIKVTTPGGTATSSTSFTVNSAPPPPHIMIITMENKEYGNIIGSSNAPYINGLVSTYRSATQWFAVQHTSLNDYLELIAGSNQGYPGVSPPYAGPTVVDNMATAGITWKAYVEGLPSACYTGGSSTTYDKTHNPFMYFNSVINSTSQCNRDVPFSGFSTDLTGGTLPNFVWVTPNNCDDMHGNTVSGSPCASDTKAQLIKAGDTWVKNNIGPVITSTWFQQGGVIILTWDEGTSGSGCCGGVATGGHVATIVIAHDNSGQGTFTSTGDHYGTLRGIEEAYGLALLGNSANASNGDLKGAF